MNKVKKFLFKFILTVNNLVLKIIPTEDKLRHYYLLSILFVLLTVKFSDIVSLAFTFLVALIWEIIQKLSGGTNTKKEMILDIFFGILLGILITIKNSI